MQGVLCYADQAVGIEIFLVSSHIKYFQAAASVILYLVTVYKYSRGKMHLITWRGEAAAKITINLRYSIHSRLKKQIVFARIRTAMCYDIHSRETEYLFYSQL